MSPALEEEEEEAAVLALSLLACMRLFDVSTFFTKYMYLAKDDTMMRLCKT